MQSKESNLWYNAIKEEMDFIASNEVWDLIKLLDGTTTIGCKLVFKTKKDH